MKLTHVEVTRGGRRITVPSSTLLVGDLCHLSVGDQVPADGVLVSSASLQVVPTFPPLKTSKEFPQKNPKKKPKKTH